MNDTATASEHRRLAILRHLAQAQDYTANASILRDVCSGVGVPSTHDQVIGALAWLQEAELITLVDHGDVVVATARLRGVEVAAGAAEHPGVARPRPRN
ncbi:MAG: VpaChn25_0724 family phage protein [Shimia sp.]